MKLLMYGVNKETVTKEDVEKYLLQEKNKKIQMKDISDFSGVEEIAVLTNDFRTEYYLYVNEVTFSHGDFLRYLAEKTDKTLQEIILETYSKFNEDVLRHLFEISCGYLSTPSGAFDILASVEHSLRFANNLETSGPILYKMFNKAIYLAYALKLNDTIKPLNQSEVSKYIYLLKEQMEELDKKHYLISGDDSQVYFLTKLLLFAGAQTITIIQKDEIDSQRQYKKIKNYLTELEQNKVIPATEKSLYYRLSRVDGAILNTEKVRLFAERIREEVAIVRQTSKMQYLVDTAENSHQEFDFPDLDLCYIDGTAKVSYNEEEQSAAIVAFDEELSIQIEEFMNYLQAVQDEVKEASY
jgi:glutamyl-tRNA reductase